MGIFSRISKILESNLNAIVERAEDPAMVLDQAIEDMKSGREEARKAIIDAKTELRLSERRRDAALKEAGDLEKKAMKALEIGDEALARRLLEAKLSADQKAAGEDSVVESHNATLGQLEAAERELDQRMREMPARRAAILARKATAEARGGRIGAGNKAQSAVAGALEAFGRIEEKVTRAEVEAEVRADLEPRPIDLRALDKAATEDALKSLKAKMAAQLPAGKQPSSSEAGGGAGSSAVDDSLAALKAKLAKS